MLVACSHSSTQRTETPQDSCITQAKGLIITSHNNYKTVEILNPWKDGTMLQTLILIPDSIDIPQNLPGGIVIRTPIKKALVYSSVHANIIKELGHIASVKGVCDPQYFTMPEIIDGVKIGTIANVGSSASPITEKIIELSPDVIILSPYQNSNFDDFTRLGIPVVQCADYMETTPLGRAEWIKLFGTLYNQSTKADSIYNNVAQSYNDLTKLAANEQIKPKIRGGNGKQSFLQARQHSSMRKTSS